MIREVYDGEFAPHGFAMQLERALDACCSIIVIEPTHLGDETARWISVGNCLHKTAVLSGLGSVVSGNKIILIRHIEFHFMDYILYYYIKKVNVKYLSNTLIRLF